MEILPKRGTTKEIQESQHVSTLGMLLLNIETKRLYIGDGASLWKDLPLIGICPDYLMEAINQ